MASTKHLPVFVAAALLAACAGDALNSTGLATTFDAAGDTIIARVAGDVAPAAVRTLAAELRIAPPEDDTSLFTEVFEFRPGRDGRLWVFDPRAATMFLFDSAGTLE